MTDEHPLPMDVPIDEHARRRAAVAFRVLIVLFIAWIIVISLCVLYGIGLLRKSAERLESCTTPGHPCFQESQKRSGAVVGGLVDAQLDAASFAAACADRPGVQGRREIHACVLASFQQHRKDEQR